MAAFKYLYKYLINTLIKYLYEKVMLHGLIALKFWEESYLGPVLDSCWFVLTRVGLVLTRVRLVLIRVDSCRARVDSCWLVSDSCWLVLDSRWLVLNSCWLALDSRWFMLTHVDSCWFVLSCIDLFWYWCIGIELIEIFQSTIMKVFEKKTFLPDFDNFFFFWNTFHESNIKTLLKMT